MTGDKRTAILCTSRERQASDDVLRLCAPCAPGAPLAATTNWQAEHEQAIAAGFDGIEVPLGSIALSNEPGDDRAADRILGELEHAGVQAKVVAATCATCDLKAALAALSPLLERAAGIGAACLNLTLPPLTGQRRAEDAQGFTRYQDALNFAYQILHQARFEAEATGVAIALEPAARGCLLSPVEMREIVDEANSWAVGACIDASRIRRIGFTSDWIRTLRHRVHAIRWHPASNEAATEPSTAMSAEVADVVRALDAIGYDRAVITFATDGRPSFSPVVGRLCGRVDT